MTIHKGYTLLEVVISLFLLSIAFLGLNVMHLRALHDIKTADYFVTANRQLINLKERLSTIQSDRELPEILNHWNQENRLSFPQGFGTVSGQFPDYDVTLFWGNKHILCTQNHIELSGCLREHLHVVSH